MDPSELDSYASENRGAEIQFAELLFPSADQLPTDAEFSDLSRTNSFVTETPQADCAATNGFDLLGDIMTYRRRVAYGPGYEQQYIAGIGSIYDERSGASVAPHVGVAALAGITACDGDTGRVYAEYGIVWRPGPVVDGVVASTIAEMPADAEGPGSPAFQQVVATFGGQSVLIIQISGDIKTDDQIAQLLMEAAERNLEVERRFAFCRSLSSEAAKAEDLCNYYDARTDSYLNRL